MNSPCFDHSILINKDSKEDKLTESNVQVIICSNEEELRNYHIKKSMDPQYRCNICSKRYTSHSALKIHKIRHRAKEDLPFHCMFCPFRAATKRDLQRHHEQHVGHARQIFKCCHCSKSFKNSGGLNEHIKSIHIKDILYKCGLCSFTCWRRSIFRLHLKIHETKVQIICPICNATFQTKSNLRIHLMTHAGEKPFACDQCNKCFTVKNHLASHQQRVHSPKTFDCELCQKRFATIHHLKRHSLIHTGERPFKCCFCSFDSNTQGNLVKHVRRIHHAVHFTYRDILKKSGLIDDPKKTLTPEDIKIMTERGRETSESYIKTLRDKGLTSVSLEQLQKEMSMKKKSKAAALLQTREEKKQKPKKSKDTLILRKNVEEKCEKAKSGKNEKKKQKIGFSFANEFVLPRIEDVIQPTGNVDGLTTPPAAIQVIWNVNYLPNVHKSSSFNKKTKNRPQQKQKKSQKSRTKNKNRKSIKEKPMLCNSVVDERSELCPSDSGPNSPSNNTLNLDVAHADCDQPSSMLEDNDLTFNDKPLLHHLHESNNLQSCSGNVLVTPLDNLHHDLVGFDEIGTPNTVVVTSEGISCIDKVYKNLDLCNQFLHMNYDEMHFINSFDSTSLQRESKFMKAESLVGSYESTCKNRLKEFKYNSSKGNNNKNNTTFSNVSQTQLYNSRNNNSINLISKSGKSKFSTLTTDHLSTDYSRLLKTKSKENGLNTGTEESNLIIDIESIDKTISEEYVNVSRPAPEEVLLFDETIVGTGEMVSSFLFIPEEDTSSQPQKEITISGSGWNHGLHNDEMEVTSIAEIEENEEEVVLVIDALS